MLTNASTEITSTNIQENDYFVNSSTTSDGCNLESSPVNGKMFPLELEKSVTKSILASLSLSEAFNKRSCPSPNNICRENKDLKPPKRWNSRFSTPTLQSPDCSMKDSIHDHNNAFLHSMMPENVKEFENYSLFHRFSKQLDSPTLFTPRNSNCTTPDCAPTSSQSRHTFDEEQLEFEAIKGKLTLWQFLLQLLMDRRYTSLIRWTNNSGEFVLLKAEEVARLWGLRKDNNHRMNYDKLSRALRYYYQKNIIRKVHGHKFVYQFIGLNRLKAYPDCPSTQDMSLNSVATTNSPKRKYQYSFKESPVSCELADVKNWTRDPCVEGNIKQENIFTQSTRHCSHSNNSSSHMEPSLTSTMTQRKQSAIPYNKPNHEHKVTLQNTLQQHLSRQTFNFSHVNNIHESAERINNQILSKRKEIERLFASYHSAAVSDQYVSTTPTMVDNSCNYFDSEAHLKHALSFAIPEILKLAEKGYLGKPKDLEAVKLESVENKPPEISSFRNTTPECKCSCHSSEFGNNQASPMPFDRRNFMHLFSSPNDILNFYNKTNKLDFVNAAKEKMVNKLMRNDQQQSRQSSVNNTLNDNLKTAESDLKNLHIQRHLINMKRFQDQISLLGCPDRLPQSKKQVFSEDFCQLIHETLKIPNMDSVWKHSLDRISSPSSSSASSIDEQALHRVKYPQQFLNLSEHLVSNSFPDHCSQHNNDSYVWMPVKVDIMSHWIDRISASIQSQLSTGSVSDKMTK